MQILLKDSKKRDVELFLNEQNRIALKRLTDQIEFHSSIEPVEIASYLLACLVDRAAGQRLVDKEAKYVFNGKQQPALMVVRPTVKGKGLEGAFGFRAVPAVITCQSYAESVPSETVSFDVVITALDVMHILSAVSQLPASDFNLIAGSLFITKNGDRLLMRSGGSEPVELTEERRRLLVHRLARYLSGQFITRDDIEGRRYSPSFYNMDGCFFNGREEPVIRVHNITTPLSFADVAAVYLTLQKLTGRQESEKKEEESTGQD